MTDERLLSRQEVAELLGIKPATLATWASKGIHIPYVKVGRLARYRESDVDAFLRRHTVTVSGSLPA